MACVVSADEHWIEPESFFREVLPATLPAGDRDRAPRLERGALVVDGQSAATFRLFPELVDFSDVQPGASDVAGRLAMMDRNGIDLAIVFPQRSMGMFALRDPELRIRCLMAYNAHIADVEARSGGRIVGVGILPSVYEPAEAKAHLAELRRLGFRIFMMPTNLRERSYGDAEMEALWSSIEESGLVCAFHTSETPDSNGPGGLGTYLMHTTQPFRKLWGHLVFAGVLERHPGVRLLFAEGGISWIPSALADADHFHERFDRFLNPRLPRRPSEYWYRQCYATFMQDAPGLEQLDRVGVEHALWSSDYPHPEGTLDGTPAILAALRRKLGEDRGDAVSGGNALRLLGLDRVASNRIGHRVDRWEAGESTRTRESC